MSTQDLVLPTTRHFAHGPSIDFTGSLVPVPVPVPIISSAASFAPLPVPPVPGTSVSATSIPVTSPKAPVPPPPPPPPGSPPPHELAQRFAAEKLGLRDTPQKSARVKGHEVARSICFTTDELAAAALHAQYPNTPPRSPETEARRQSLYHSGQAYKAAAAACIGAATIHCLRCCLPLVI